MRKLTLLFSLILFLQISLLAQNVGIGTTEPVNKLQVQGSLLVTASTTATSTPPTAGQIKTMVSASTISFANTDSTGRVYDPGGPGGNYAANQLANTSISSVTNAIGIEITVESMDLSSADSLIIKESISGATLMAVGNLYSSTGKWVFNSSSLYIIFKSNSDANVGAGFSLLFRRLYNETASQPDVSGFTGNALLFDTKKGLFRSGAIKNPVQGDYSTAMGFNTEATKYASVALGNSTKATGDYSTALGNFTTASGNSSFATGFLSNASGGYTTAGGYFATASGDNAISFGYKTFASGLSSIALGDSARAIGNGSFASGASCIASGEYSTAMGSFSTASGQSSTAIGRNASATGVLSTALGYSATASADRTVAIGSHVESNFLGTRATALGAVAIGSSTTASGTNSTALGSRTYASGNYSTAIGLSTNAGGINSTAMGYATTANGDNATAMGNETTASSNSATAFGNNTTASGTSSVAMGSGTFATNNAATAMGLNTNAFGAQSTAMGFNTTASGAQSTAMGYHTTASGDHSTAIGSYVSTNNLDGSLIIGDISTNTVLNIATANSFRARFDGGYRFFTSSLAINAESCQLPAGGNAWVTASDSRLKEKVTIADGEDFLKKISLMKLGSWNYLSQNPLRQRHYGPMAQDFFSAFGKDEFGTIGNDTTINSADFDGVNLIAIQALEKRTQKIEVLETENEELKKMLLQLRKEMDELKTITNKQCIYHPVKHQ